MKRTKKNFPEKPLKPGRHPIRQKLLSCVLCICLLLVSLPVESYGSEVQAEESVTVEHAGVMVPGKESAQTLQEPEENLLEESKSDRDFAEDMDLQMDKIPEERIAVTAEGEEGEEVGEDPKCGVITQDTVWKAGNLGGGDLVLENNATLTLTGMVTVERDIRITGEGTIVKAAENAYFAPGKDFEINGKITLDGKNIPGGMPFIYCYGKVTLDGGCIIQNMKSKEGVAFSAVSSKGGVFNDVTIKDCSTPWKGGAVGNDGSGYVGGSDLIINGGVYENNAAGEAGGLIYNDAGTVTVNGGTFRNNSTAKEGGCIHNGDRSSNRIIINGGVYENNIAGEKGGCIYNSFGTVTINGGTFTDNSARQGGCIYNKKNLTVSGGVFSNNTSPNPGGAIYSEGSDGKFYLEGDVEFQGIDDSLISYTDSIEVFGPANFMYGREALAHPVKVFTSLWEGKPIIKGEDGYTVQKKDRENINIYNTQDDKGKWYAMVGEKNNEIYAVKEKPDIFNVFYHSNGAEGTPVTDDTDYHTGETVTVKEPTGLSLTGQTFKEWNTQPDGTGTPYAPGAEITVEEENITLYAIFEPEVKDTFTARFYSGGEGLYEDRTFADGTLTAPDLQELSGWTPLGWNRKQDDFEKNTVAPNAPLTLTDALTEFYGVYRKEVTLAYEMDGEGSAPESGKEFCYASVYHDVKIKNAVFTIDAGPSRNGYRFVGWNTQADGNGTFYQEGELLAAEQSVTLYACYEKEADGKKTLIADFYSGSEGGKISRTVEVNAAGQEGTIHTPGLQEMAGWTPLGWSHSVSEYKGIVEADTDIQIKENISLYGVYQKDITLTYDGNGSEDVPEPETKARYANVHGTVTYQEAEFIPEGVSTRAGYRFVNWNTQPDGKGTGYGKEDVVSPEENMTLYAIWEEDSEVVDYRVEYYCQNLTGEDYTRMDGDTKLLANLVGTEVEARQKTYIGFTVNLSHPSGKPKGKVEADGSLVLKLYYDRNVYEVDFNLNGGYGKAPDTQKIRYGGLLHPVSDPLKSGYSFKGWYVDEDGLEDGLWDFESPVENNTGALKTTLYAKWADELAPEMGKASFHRGSRNFLDWLIQKESMVITVPVTEEGSGLAKAEYLLVAEDGTERDGQALLTETHTPDTMAAYGSSAAILRGIRGEAEKGSYEARIAIEEEFKGKVYLTCTDHAGNVSPQKTLTAEGGGVIVEDNAPEIRFEGTEETTGGKPLEIKVKVRDNREDRVTSGIAGIRYQADKGKKVSLPEEDFAGDFVDTYEFTVKIKGEGKHTLRVEAKDQAGNESAAEVTLNISGKREVPAEVPGNSEPGNPGRPGSPLGGEPKTGDSTQIQICATLAMIAGFGYLLLYFEGENGITEEEKEEIISRLVSWAKQGGRIRRLLGVAIIFLFLAYYHSIGKSVDVEWKEVYGRS